MVFLDIFYKPQYNHSRISISFHFFFFLHHRLTLSLLNFFYHCSNCFHLNLNPLDGGLFLCCGQWVGKKGDPRHVNCSGSSSSFKVGGLFLEMEFCPFPRCAQTFVDPESNISHQEEVHHSVKMWMYSICEINFVSGGCSTRHILSFHKGPMGYAEDLNDMCESSRSFSFST